MTYDFFFGITNSSTFAPIPTFASGGIAIVAAVLAGLITVMNKTKA